MSTITPRHQIILDRLKQNSVLSFSELFALLEINISERTLSRDLADLVAAGILSTAGGGRSLVYTLTTRGRFFIPIDAAAYGASAPDVRTGALIAYQFDIFTEWPTTLFSNNELSGLRHQTDAYLTRAKAQSYDIRRKELERFIIELSWKSSRIEGNTYTLLDTEALLRDGIASKTNTPEETTIILNHKVAFDFVLEHALDSRHLTRGFVEHVHTLLMTGLLSDLGLRKSSVGISGSTYQPLYNQFQIAKALDHCIAKITTLNHGFDQALTALLCISYIQPFVDGNKRIARLIANALLLAHSLAPLSYRNVDEVEYRATLLAFYEQLSIVPMKKIFMEQYLFATEHYS